MVQEIITYMIIGSAATLAVLKAVNKFSPRTSKKSADSESGESSAHQHRCNDCPAECVLRDATSEVIQSNQELCKKVESKSN